MTLPLTSPPSSICILRLSALGDISHTLPVVRTLQHVWPNTNISWIIGKQEYQLVEDLQNIEFIPFDKKAGLGGYIELRNKLKNRHFDVLLDMQMSLRASMAALLIKSPIKLGFDKQRAKDFQWLFTNHKIQFQPKQHVIDSFFGFLEALGIKQKYYEWNLPVNDFAITSIAPEFSASKPYIVISPCSSMPYRNWNADGYAKVSDYIQQNYDHQVVLCGGPTEIEQSYATDILNLTQHKPINLIGKTSIPQLMSVLKNAELVISPDAGPAHLATAVNTPVIGLYATTNPDRARPYKSAELVVNKYPEAIQDKFGVSVDEVPWGTRVRDEGTMDRISANDVIQKVDKFLSSQWRNNVQ